MKNETLGTKLNPTVLTARAALMGGAAKGDRYALRLLERLNADGAFEESRGGSGDSGNEELYRFSSNFGTAAWVRNIISNKMFDSLRMTSFFDIGCGFNHRGLYLMDGRFSRYYGIDLPPVIDRMKSAVITADAGMALKERVMYCSADATDHNALRAIPKNKEPLFIVTEGLMMYLTENEMQTVVENISELLIEYGGVWFTGDSEERTFFADVLRRFLGNDESAVKRLIGTELSERWRNLLHENSFMKLKGEEFKDFLKSKGLNCRKAEIRPFIRNIQMPDNIRKAFESTDFFMMTSAVSDMKYSSPAKANAFDLDTGRSGESYLISVRGRLDSLTAPKLVEKYEAFAGGAAVPLVLDMADCPYISSAGIRAVLMLYKRTANIKDGFAIRNIRPDVLDILTTTGFTDLVGDV